MGQDPDEVQGPRHRRTEAGPGARRRTQSSSRAEEIVTCELKARKAQPDHPIHSPCDSLLSWSSNFRNYEGVFNWGALLLFLGSLRICLENLLSMESGSVQGGGSSSCVGIFSMRNKLTSLFCTWCSTVLYLQ